ncbi:MAG: hypothetical protein WEF86_14295 [Gemmatimonadota bacterium]
MSTKASLPAQLSAATLDGPGDTDAGLRRSVNARAAAHATGARLPALPEPLVAYVDKVALHAWRITDDDTTALRVAGYSDDDIFELTIAAAAGAGLARLDRGLAALKGEI